MIRLAVSHGMPEQDVDEIKPFYSREAGFLDLPIMSGALSDKASKDCPDRWVICSLKQKIRYARSHRPSVHGDCLYSLHVSHDFLTCSCFDHASKKPAYLHLITLYSTGFYIGIPPMR